MGEGIEGALASARIDREEAAVTTGLRKSELLASAARWESQAHALERYGDAPPNVFLGLGDQLHALRNLCDEHGYHDAKDWLTARMREGGL